MKLLSEIVSKKVLNLYSGRIEGTIKDVSFNKDYKKLSSLKIFDEDEEEYTIAVEKIYNIGQDSVVIRNSNALVPTINQIYVNQNNIINYNVYSINGDHLGKIIDAELNENLTVKEYITNEIRFSPKQIVNIGENIIVNNSENKVKLSNFKPKTPIQNKVEHNQIVKILGPQIENQNDNVFKISASPSPKKIVGNTELLIGRKALKTIYGENGEMIIKEENIVTQKVLDLASQFNKIGELTTFSRQI